MTLLLKNSQIAQTIFLFFRIVSSKNELFFTQNLNPQQALKKIISNHTESASFSVKKKSIFAKQKKDYMPSVSIFSSHRGKKSIKKVFKKHFRFLPVFLMDTIFYFWRFEFTLNQSCIFQFFQMLRNGGLRQRKNIHQVTRKAASLVFQMFQYCDTSRMPKCLCKTSKFFRIGLIINIF